MATAKKRVRSGRPVWQLGRSKPVPHGHLCRDIEIDILVIGAGITGALIADALAASGRSVAIIDKRGPAKGSTLASTALVPYEIDTPLTKLAHKIGKANAVRAWRRSRLAVDSLAARFSELCVPSVQVRDTLYLAGDVLDGEALWREHNARRASGLASRFLDRKALHQTFGIRREAALQSFGNLVIDPRKAALALLNAAVTCGSQVYAPVEVIDVHPGREGVTVTADSGRQICCRQLVFATGYELPTGAPHDHHRIHSTWAIATAPQRRACLWPGECMIWEASDPYLYIRTTDEGRVICGGEDEKLDDAEQREALIPRKVRILCSKLGRLLPNLDMQVEFAWTGAFGETTTGLPIVARLPGMSHCWIALGYGGNGITYASIAADIITSALSGHPDVDADLYGFS